MTYDYGRAYTAFVATQSDLTRPSVSSAQYELYGVEAAAIRINVQKEATTEKTGESELSGQVGQEQESARQPHHPRADRARRGGRGPRRRHGGGHVAAPVVDAHRDRAQGRRRPARRGLSPGEVPEREPRGGRSPGVARRLRGRRRGADRPGRQGDH